MIIPFIRTKYEDYDPIDFIAGLHSKGHPLSQKKRRKNRRRGSAAKSHLTLYQAAHRSLDRGYCVHLK